MEPEAEPEDQIGRWKDRATDCDGERGPSFTPRVVSLYSHVSVKSNLPAGTLWLARCARIAAKNEGIEPATWAARRGDGRIRRGLLALKAAVAPARDRRRLAAPLVNPTSRTTLSNDARGDHHRQDRAPKRSR